MNTNENESAFSTLVTWVRGQGGSVDDRLRLAVVDGVRGIVAHSYIEEGTLLLHCPWHLIIGSSGSTQTDGACEVIWALETELQLGEQSFWYPYFRLNVQNITRLPTLWDPHTLQELQGLPPYDATRHTDWFQAECLDGESISETGAETRQALIEYLTRAFDQGMIPVCDLFNHHNGKLNTSIETTETGLQVVTARPVPDGSQIYYSYGAKPASSLFRDYGFIEQWPQEWFWVDANGQTHTFVRFPCNVVAIEPTQEFTAEFGNLYLPLENYLHRASEHTRHLSVETLHQFKSAAQTLLDELPTSLGEDEEILKTLNNLTVDAQATENKRSDLIACVSYRLEFKRAVQAAISATQGITAL